MPLGGASWFVTPTLAWRYTGYRLDNQLAENLNPGNPEASPSRSTPISSLDAGLYFDRNIRFRGDDYVNTLEPRLFYLNRSEEHTSELQSLMRISYAVFCLKKKKTIISDHDTRTYSLNINQQVLNTHSSTK